MPRVTQEYNQGAEILQTPGFVTIFYESMHDVRVIPLNAGPHLPSNVHQWLGDSRGHWEGDTLVIDTIGVRTEAITSIDRFGTPQSEAMHIIERYRLIDYEDAKEGLDRDAKENRRAGVGINRNYRGKHLQLLLLPVGRGDMIDEFQLPVRLEQPGVRADGIDVDASELFGRRDQHVRHSARRQIDHDVVGVEDAF